MFLYPTRTKINQNGKKFTYTSIKQLNDDQIWNVVAIQSDLGDGLNRH